MPCLRMNTSRLYGRSGRLVTKPAWAADRRNHNRMTSMLVRWARLRIKPWEPLQEWRNPKGVSSFQRSNQVRYSAYAVFRAPALQTVHNFFRGAGVPEIRGANSHRSRAG